MKLEYMKNNYDKKIVWGGVCPDRINELEIAYIVDCDKDKQGTMMYGLRIEAPEKILEENMEKICIITFLENWKDVVIELDKRKITADVILPSMLEPNPFSKERGVIRGYSQFGEDAIIRGISKTFGIEIKHYVDIGANNPIYGNSTMLFYLEGAQGCLVEPNNAYTDRIKKCRPRDTVWNLGIASMDDDGKEKEYFEIEKYDTRNTFSKEKAERYRNQGFEVKSKKIKLISINSLLDSYGEKVDYINIDVEGLEWEVMKDYDFTKYDVDVFNIEKGRVQVKNLMLENKYELVAETPSNWIFVKAGKVVL